MARDTKTRLVIFALAVVIISVVARTVNQRPADETPLKRAYRLCSECGFDRAQVDQLVDDAAHSTLDRQKQLELFYSTFGEDDPDPELCRPCADGASLASHKDRGASFFPGQSDTGAMPQKIPGGWGRLKGSRRSP